MESYYGVIQNHHGSDKLFIYSKSQLEKALKEINMLEYVNIPTKKNETGFCDLFPIGGSNSGPGIIGLLETENDIKDFLNYHGEMDYEDPTLIELAEYYVEIVTDKTFECCTEEWLIKLNLDKEELEKKDIKDIEDLSYEICEKLNITMKDFYDLSYRDIRVSEIDDLAKEIELE